MTPELAPLLVAWLVVFIFSTTLHEAAHAWAALRLGDETAYLGGQVSLNPIPHMQREPFGMLIVPVVSFLLMGGRWMIGWASAPYDPRWAYHYPRKAAWMALAGPVSNLLIALVAGLGLRVGLATGFFTEGLSALALDHVVAPSAATGSQGLAMVLSIAFSLNLVLFLFNLIPLPPMDGSAVVQLFMPEKFAQTYQEYMSNPMWSWVGIIAAWQVFPTVFSPFYGLSVMALYGFPG